MMRLFFSTIWCLFFFSILLGGVGFTKEISRTTLELNVGGAQILDMPVPIKRVSLINPDIADIVVLSSRKVYAYGKNFGFTSVILWEENTNRNLMIDVVVTMDLTSLKEKLHELFPRELIKVYSSETGVVLSGTVSSPEVMEQVLRLTRTYLPKIAKLEQGGAGTGRSGGGVTNLMKIGGIQQVMLEVKFAEVNRSSSKNWQAGIGLGKLGNDFSGAASAGGSVTTPLESSDLSGTLPGGTQLNGTVESVIDGLVTSDLNSLLLNVAGNASNIFINVDNFTASLQLLENEGLARILAEPRLVTQSGKEASFLAGGEFPIPVAQDDGTISIEFKEFGVSLRFTPIVLEDGKISLRVTPSVSRVSSASSVPAGIVGANYIVPTFATRKLDTTVELHDGQTLALAGLLQDELREQVDKIPGLGDLPVLGALFRSTAYLQEKTDLLIAVTPHLVRPVQEGELEFPGENFQAPGALEYYLEGRLEGRRDSENNSGILEHGFSARRGGLEGEFGNQPLEMN